MNCPICDSNATAKTIPEFSAYACDKCQFIFADPAAKSSAPELYDEAWSKKQIHPTYIYANGRFTVNNAWKLKKLLDRLEEFRKLDRILDVGCSAAFFLKLAKDRGWSPQGVEVAEWAVKFSSEQLGIPVFHGLLQDAAFPTESFDVVFSSHVIEHIQRPSVLVEEMRRVLRPGGALVTIVPTQFRSPKYIFLKSWYGEGPPRHVSFFIRKSLENMLRKKGFRILSSRQNIELQLLLRQLRQMTLFRPMEVKQDSQDGNVTPAEDLPVPVRVLKGVVNRIGTFCGIGDEICTIAVKQA